eukprot:511402_1
MSSRVKTKSRSSMSLYAFNNAFLSHSFGIFLIITNLMFCYWMWLSLKARNINKWLTFYLMISPIIGETNHIFDYAFFVTNYDVFRNIMFYCESSSPNPLFEISLGNYTLRQQFEQFPLWLIFASYIFNTLNAISLLIGIGIGLFWMYTECKTWNNVAFISALLCVIMTINSIRWNISTINSNNIYYYYSHSMVHIFHHVIFMAIFYHVSISKIKHSKKQTYMQLSHSIFF